MKGETTGVASYSAENGSGRRGFRRRGKVKDVWFTEATKETQFTKAWGPLDELFRNALVQVNGKKIYA